MNNEIKFFGNAKFNSSDQNVEDNPLTIAFNNLQSNIYKSDLYKSGYRATVPHSVLDRYSIKSVKSSNIKFPINVKVAYSSGNLYHENIEMKNFKNFSEFASLIFSKDKSAQLLISNRVSPGKDIFYMGDGFIAFKYGEKNMVFKANTDLIFSHINLSKKYVYICACGQGTKHLFIHNFIPADLIDINEFGNCSDIDSMNDDELLNFASDVGLFLAHSNENNDKINYIDFCHTSNDMQKLTLAIIANRVNDSLKEYFGDLDKNTLNFHLIKNFGNENKGLLIEPAINIVNFFNGDSDKSKLRESLKTLMSNNVNTFPLSVSAPLSEIGHMWSKCDEKYLNFQKKMKNMNQSEYIKSKLNFPKIDVNDNNCVENIEIFNQINFEKTHLRISAVSNSSLSVRFQGQGLRKEVKIKHEGEIIHEESNFVDHWIEKDFKITNKLVNDMGWQSLSSFEQFVNENSDQKSMAGTNAQYCWISYDPKTKSFHKKGDESKVLLTKSITNNWFHSHFNDTQFVSIVKKASSLLK